MAVVIRMRRMGMKNDPIFRVVVTDSRFKRDGRFIENVGTYNPIAPGGTSVTLKNDRILHWLSVGAQPSDTVWSLLKKAGIPKPAHNRKSKKAEKALTAKTDKGTEKAPVKTKKTESAEKPAKAEKPKAKAKKVAAKA